MQKKFAKIIRVQYWSLTAGNSLQTGLRMRLPTTLQWTPGWDNIVWGEVLLLYFLAKHQNYISVSNAEEGWYCIVQVCGHSEQRETIG